MARDLITLDKSTYESLQQELIELRQVVTNLAQTQPSSSVEYHQKQMALFIEYTPAAIAIFDNQMRYILASRRWRKDYRLGDEEIIGRSHYEIFPNIPSNWREIHQRCLAGAIEKSEADMCLHTDGTTDWTKWEIHPWYENPGEIGGIIIFTEVITALKEAEAALKDLNEELEARVEEQTAASRQSEAKLQRLTDNLPGMIYEFRLDPDGTMSFPMISSGCQEITGLAAEDIRSDASLIFNSIHLEDVLNVKAAITHSAQTLQNYEHEFRIITPDGQCKWLKSISKPELQPEGEILWSGCMFDITEQQAALSSRQQTEAQLKEQEQFLRSIYDGFAQIIFVVDVLENGKFCYAGWNSAAEEATGMRKDQVIGKTPEDLQGTVEGAAVTQRYQSCIEAGIGITYEECLTFQAHETWWMTKINPLTNSEGQIYRLVGTTLNITERKQAEIKLQQQAKNLEHTLHKLQRTQAQLIHSEKMSSIGNMVAGVAHEINNPVNFIHGNLIPASEYTQDLLRLVELYQKYYPHPPEEISAEIEAIDLEFLKEDLIKLIQSMCIGTARIREIVLSLRNFSRLDESDFKQVDIHEGINSTLMILQNRLKAKPNHPEIVVIKEYGNLPPVDCYPGQLNQVFMNLLSNAIEALEETSLENTKQICIQTEVINSNWISIQISDNGLGISEAVSSKLFDPFFTTKDVGKGTGLGLSISYQIVVDKHHGKLSCHSKLGKGARFIIKIPISQPNSSK